MEIYGFLTFTTLHVCVASRMLAEQSDRKRRKRTWKYCDHCHRTVSNSTWHRHQRFRQTLNEEASSSESYCSHEEEFIDSQERDLEESDGSSISDKDTFSQPNFEVGGLSSCHAGIDLHTLCWQTFKHG